MRESYLIEKVNKIEATAGKIVDTIINKGIKPNNKHFESNLLMLEYAQGEVYRWKKLHSTVKRFIKVGRSVQQYYSSAQSIQQDKLCIEFEIMYGYLLRQIDWHVDSFWKKVYLLFIMRKKRYEQAYKDIQSIIGEIRLSGQKVLTSRKHNRKKVIPPASKSLKQGQQPEFTLPPNKQG